MKVLRFSKNLGWSQFAYLELRKTRSGFSIPLDFEIAKVACNNDNDNNNKFRARGLYKKNKEVLIDFTIRNGLRFMPKILNK